MWKRSTPQGLYMITAYLIEIEIKCRYHHNQFFKLACSYLANPSNRLESQISKT